MFFVGFIFSSKILCGGTTPTVMFISRVNNYRKTQTQEQSRCNDNERTQNRLEMKSGKKTHEIQGGANQERGFERKQDVDDKKRVELSAI